MTAPVRPLRVGEEPPPLRPSPASPRAAPTADTTRPKGRASTTGRFRLLNAFVDFAVSDLTRGELAVWLILYRDSRDGIARTSYADLARRAGCDRRTVGRAVRRLEAAGLLRIVRRGGPRRGVSHYRVCPPPEG
jgi:hypothetical protein